MLFSSMTFLWIFLPIVLLGYYIVPKPIKNYFLLVASLLFYSWGEPIYILLMLISIATNYFLALSMNFQVGACRKFILVLALIFNLGLLGYFKYFDMVIHSINSILNTQISDTNIILPIGISFYTFQILSYIIDLYRKKIEVQKNIFKLGLYISFFPQLIAGPIVNYKDFCNYIDFRTTTIEKTTYGIKRFIYGLGKKVIISNTLASAVDTLFGMNVDITTTFYVWLAVILYSLQIYFDFSGYSDMAIGLGKIFGFDFKENFDYPYTATSITDFWKRWHISLTSWFRDYVYIPLGGNRKGNIRTYINIAIVFTLTGLWHGAAFAFIAWGVWHGAFMLFERMWFKKVLDKCKYKFINRIYTMFVVLIGWVFFRAGGLSTALKLLKIMFIPTEMQKIELLPLYIGTDTIIIAVVAILLCGVIQQTFPKLQYALYNEQKTGMVQNFVLIAVLLFSIVLLVSDSYNPFIYFRF